MVEMSAEERALEKARARLGDLVSQTIAYSGGDKAELERQIHAAQIDVYRASIAAEEAHRRAMLAIIDQQAPPSIMKDSQLAKVVEGLRRGVNAESEKKLRQLKVHLEDALAKGSEGEGS